MAIPGVRLRQRWRVVHAVADHRHRRPWASGAATLVYTARAGSHVGDDLSDAELAGDAKCRLASLSPVSITGARHVMRDNGVGEVCRASATLKTAAILPAMPTHMTVRVLGGEVGPCTHQVAEVDVLVLHQYPATDRRPVPVDRGDGALAGMFSNPEASGRGRRAGGRRRSHEGLRYDGSTMLDRGGVADDGGLVVVGEHQLGDLRLALEERAECLSTLTTTSIRAAVLKAVAVFEEHAPLSGARPTMIAVGVARPRASGHVITTTVMA